MKKILLISILLFQLLTISSCSMDEVSQVLEEDPTSITHVFPTLPPPTSIPTETAIPTVTATATSTEPLPTPTEHGVTNPQGILPAGMPVIQDNYVMVVDVSGMTIDGDYIGFEIQLRVLGEVAKLFRYNASSIILEDDLGNRYDYLIKSGFGTRCTESDIYKAKQILIEPGEKVIIEPNSDMMFSSYFWWCLDNHDEYVPGYTGQIPPQAKALILKFEGFGPFSGFGYKFDL